MNVVVINASPRKRGNTAKLCKSVVDGAMDNGEFVQLTEREIIEDEISLIEQLDVLNSVYFFGHHQNNVARVSGHFKNKEGLIDGFKQKLHDFEINQPEILDIALTREYL